jgi:hypothetical protein
MTVQELIQQLQTLPQDKQVVLSHTDHTDWNYTVELTPDLVSESKWWKEELTDEDYLLMEERIDNDTYEENSEYPDVVEINCKFW